MITRKSLADEIDLLDADIKVLNESKRDCFDAYRDQMIADGIAKPNIKAEIDAVKVAIKRRREAAKDEHALIEKDELIDEVFHEITRAPRATRENIEKFDTETGEVFDEGEAEGIASGLANNQPETATTQRVNGHSQHEGANAQATVRNEVVTVVGTESGTVANSEIAPASQGEAEAPTGSTSGKTEGGNHEVAETTAAKPYQAGPISFSENRPATFVLRPNCLRPESCAGHGSTHCHSCRVAMREGVEA